MNGFTYRVEMLVESGEDTDVFVAFDSVMSNLTGVRAAEVANPMVCSIKYYNLCLLFH